MIYRIGNPGLVTESYCRWGGQRQGRGGYSDYTKRMLTLCDGVNININPDILPGYFKFSSEDDI